MLYSSISQKKGENIIRIGMVVKNCKNEVLLIKDKINRINKQIYSIPFVEVNEVKEEKIINEFNDKYGLKIDKLEGYINETNVLDDKCDEILQINMSCKSDNANLQDGIWNHLDEVLNNIKVPSNVKECIEVYKYNSNLNHHL